MKLFPRSIAFLIVAIFSSLAHSQNTIWRNTGDTSFENPSNWNNGVPAAGYNAYIVPDGIGETNGSFVVTPGGQSAIIINAATSHVSNGLFIVNDVGNTLRVGSVTLTFALGTTYTITNTVGVRDSETFNFVGNLTVGNAVNVGDVNSGTMNVSMGTIDASTATLTIGGATGSVGTFSQTGSSTVLVNNLDLGTGSGNGSYNITGTGNTLTLSAGGFADIAGTFTQNDATSTVDFSAGGTDLGSGAAYNLEAGNLLLGTTIVGTRGTLNQTAGTLTANGAVDVDGTYNLGAGTATFNAGLIVDATGTVNQTGGTLTITTGQTLDLSAVGSTYNLGGGILQVGDGGLAGTSGEGMLNFSGGTLQITSTTAGAFTDPLDSTLTGVSTIDAVTTPGITSVTLAGNLSGQGGITFEGAAGTTFQFTGTNSYTGPTTISGGTLDVTGANIASSSALNIVGANTVANLTVEAGGLAYAGAISGSGTLNVDFAAAGAPFVVLNSSNFSGVLKLGADNVNNGTLQLYGGTFNNIQEGAPGSGVVIGGAPLAAFPIGTTIPTTGSVTFGSATYTGPTMINSGFTLNGISLTSAVTLGTVGTPGGSLNLTDGLVGDLTNNGGTANVTGAAGITGTVTNGIGGVINTTSVTGNVTNSGLFTASTNPNTVTGSFTNNNTGVIMATSGLPGVIDTPTFTFGNGLTLSNGGTGGTLVVRLNGSVADDYSVSGAPANLDNGVVKVVVLGGGVVGMPITYQIVNDAGGVTDAGLTTSSNTALFTYTLTNTGTAENLVVTQAPIGTYATTPNQMAVARAIDGTSSSLFGFFGSIPLGSGAAIIPGALDELSPESLQYARNIAFENSTFLVERMNDVDANLRGGYGGLDTSAINVVTPGFESGLGRSLGSLLAYNDPAFHNSAPNGVNYYPGGSDNSSSPSAAAPSSSSSAPVFDSSTQVISDSPNPYLATANPSAPGSPRLSEFIGGDVILADLNQNQSATNAPSSKASYTAGDVTAGVSFRMNSHLAAGVLFDYNHTHAKTDSNGSTTDVDSYSPGLFATYFDHGFYANGLFSFGYNNYSNTRDISILGENASSHPTGQQYVGDVDFGYDFHPSRNWIVGPTLGVTYTHLDIDSFTETGAPGADLAVQDQSADSLRSRLGGHVIFQTNTGDVLLQPNLTAMWQHEYLDNGSGITSSFNDFSSSPFTIETAAPSRDSALVGIGMTATLSNSMALYLNYLADVGASNYFAQSVVGGFKARF